MAIDSRRKRASVAALGLAFLGPSIVPDGTLGAEDRQVVAHSYYGIAAGGAFVEIGGTSQLEALASTGGITLERVIGGTSQLEAHTSTGGVTLERVIGGTSQLAAFASGGAIQVGDVIVAEATTGGGKKRRRSKYPRRVMIDGVLQWVRNAQEERQLLQAMADRARDAAKVAEALEDTQLAETIKTRSIRIEKRIATVDTREAEWRQHLINEDEEILLLFQ